MGELKLLIGQLTQEEISVRLEKLQKSATLTMKELRETIYGRSFEKNGRKSFSSQLENYIDEVCKLHNINIETNIDPKANNLTPAQKIVIYRISCEAINNAVRHGGADNVYVKIEEKDSRFICPLRMTVRDLMIKNKIPITDMGFIICITWQHYLKGNYI